MVIFRENTEDIYAGIEFEAGSAPAARLARFLQEELGVDYPFGNQTALGIKPVSEGGSRRLIRAAIAYAIEHELPSVSLVHKGNIMKYTEGAFKNWGYRLAEEEFRDHVYTWDQWEQARAKLGEEAANNALNQAREEGKVIIKDVIADNFLQQILLNPQDYSVIATLNLNGDYVSDALAALVGGIGIAPGGNINYDTGHAVFEATHGTAPRFADTDTMNPSSVILSGVMLFEYIGWQDVANLIVQALQQTILQKTVTIDFYNQMEQATLLKTSEFARAVIGKMGRL
jgi:isocitrate dehydrogenase